MSTFGELYGVDHRGTLQFFYTGLTEVVPTGGELTKKETLYVASVLAHYAQTSRYETRSMPVLADLAELFDCFVLSQLAGLEDAELLEVAGAQSLFFLGFFDGQLKGRHNLNWFGSIGQSFFEKASRRTGNTSRKELLRVMSYHFPPWTGCLRKFNANLRDSRFIINLPRNEES